jgi:hypothetical protein
LQTNRKIVENGWKYYRIFGRRLKNKVLRICGEKLAFGCPILLTNK